MSLPKAPWMIKKDDRRARDITRLLMLRREIRKSNKLKGNVQRLLYILCSSIAQKERNIMLCKMLGEMTSIYRYNFEAKPCGKSS